MKKILVILLSFGCLMLFSDSFARVPNPGAAIENCTARCGEVARDCNKACSRPGASSSEIALCHKKCGIHSADCYSKCNIHTKKCAEQFAYCIRNAKTEDAKKNCQDGYHHCKGTGTFSE